MKHFGHLSPVFLALSLWGCSGLDPGDDGPTSVETEQGLFYVVYQPISGEVPFNELFSLDIRVYDGLDHATIETGVEIYVDARMPAHGHGMNVIPSVLPFGDGTFRVDGMLFHMRGEWRIDVTVTEGSDFDIAHFTLQM